MAAQWTPPPNGKPCWINLFATDVQRARKFYEEAFGWKFRSGTKRMDGLEEDPSHIAHFDHGPHGTSGGITKVGADEFVSTKGKGGAVLYMWVDSLEEAMQKVVAAGGKQMTEIQPEGKNSLMQHFEDSEGNYAGLFTMKN